MAFASFVNSFWSVLVIIANLISVALVVSFFSPKFRESRFIGLFADKSLAIAFLTALLATIGSLIYSDYIGYEPCKLCWFQRIFMYPLAVILGIAAFRNDISVKLYGIVLSIIGATVALFHYVGQLGWNPFALECLAIGQSTSCAKNFVLQFGYITIPMMALSAFVLIALVLAIRTPRQ